jgi:YbbR domain-containing protein
MIRFLRAHVWHNLGLKIIALAVATAMWAAVARDPMAEVAVTVPIEFQHVPDNIEISSEVIPRAQIRLRGPGRTVSNLTTGQVHADVDLAGVRPGERTYDLNGPQIHVPRGVEVIQVVPSQIHLSFDRRARKQVPVRARVIGMYGRGGMRTEVSVEPATAWIVGPEKRVDSIESVLTDAVDATGLTGKATFPGVHVYVTDPLVRVAEPSTVEVTVRDSGGRSESPGR